MNYFYLNPNAGNTIMQIIILLLLIVIAILFISRQNQKEEIIKAVQEIDVSCPACPEIPKMKDSEGKECPPCNCPEQSSKCPTSTSCPTLDDIIGGIFPGRNRGITQNGKYFPINSYEKMEIVPAYSSVIDKMPAFENNLILGTQGAQKKQPLSITGSKDPQKDKASSDLELKGSGILQDETTKDEEPKDELQKENKKDEKTGE
jgi:hypothetical protein